MSEQGTIDLYAIESIMLDLALKRTIGPRAEAVRALRLAVEQAQGRMKLAHDKGGSPGITNIFTGVRVPLNWQKRHGGCYDLLLWLATVTHACIIAGERVLSETPVLTDTDILRDLMRFIVTDTGISIKTPFPYTQTDMRRAFEEWNTGQEREP